MDSFGSILDAALAQNLELQYRNRHLRDEMPYESWLEEYCVVSLSFGRQTGKTTAIARRATRGDLVITYNWATGQRLLVMKMFNPDLVSVKAIKSAHSKHYDRIWVDEASLIEDRSVILDLAMKTDARQIILVG